jgi:O-Antigen ligase
MPVVGNALLALVPGALTVYLGLNDGGFFPGTTALAATEVGLGVALVLLVARRPWEGVGLALVVAAVAVGGLAAWTLASSGWSDAPARATLEYTRVLLYVLTLVLFGMLGFSARRVRWMLYGVAGGIVVVCAVALIARTLPDIIFDAGLVDDERLGYPLGYWNALALLAAIGIVFCGHLACSTQDPWPARVLGAASIPLLTAVLYYTFSRGGTWVAVGGVIVYVLVARPRGTLCGALATVPTSAIVLLAINPPNDLTDVRWGSAQAMAAGHRVALVVGLCCLAAAGLRALTLPLDGLVRRLRLPERIHRPAMVAASIALVGIVLAGSAAFDVPSVVQAKYDEFTAADDGVPSYAGGSRLLSAQNNGRWDHWDVALSTFREDRLHGSGAGTYGLHWARERPDSVSVQDAHSFYLELLGELGLLGLALGVIALAMVLGAFAFRARGPDRALFAALLAAGLAWAVHAAVDWDWEMAAVTLWLFAFGGAALARKHAGKRTLPSWTIAVRAGAVALCLALVVLPARVAVSQARIDTSLDALERGDCRAARAEARRSLSAVSGRAVPYHVIGFCDMQEGRLKSAVRAMTRSVERDPRNWELRYSLAVARALAGLDPAPQLARAARLNPREPLVGDAAAAFRKGNVRAWRRAGARAQLTLPGPPTP